MLGLEKRDDERDVVGVGCEEEDELEAFSACGRSGLRKDELPDVATESRFGLALESEAAEELAE